MFCSQCGQQNPDDSTFCMSCGHALNQPPQNGAPQITQTPPEMPPAVSVAVPKKRRTGLIIGIIAGVVVVAGAVVAAILLFGGDKGIPVEGVWYSEDNGDVLKFKDGGRVTQYMPDDDVRGEYDYDPRTGEGVLTLDDEDYDFTADGDELDVDSMGVYERADDDFDIDDFLDELAEEVAAVPADTPVPEITPAPTPVPTPTPEPTPVVETVTEQTMTLTFAFGERSGTYTGEIVDGVPHGYGTYSTVNPEGLVWTYEGQWRSGHFEGEGTTVWDDGFTEGGTYTGDYLNGQGWETWQGRMQYEGGYQSSEFHGQGTLYDYHGEIIYSGAFNNGYISETAEARAARVGAFKNQCVPTSVGEMYNACAEDLSIRCETSGTVLTVSPNENYCYIQIYEQGVEGYDTIISIDYWLSEGETPPEYGQWVTVWGTTEYVQTYVSTDGTDMAVPLLWAWSVE